MPIGWGFSQLDKLNEQEIGVVGKQWTRKFEQDPEKEVVTDINTGVFTGVVYYGSEDKAKAAFEESRIKMQNYLSSCQKTKNCIGD